MRTAFASWKLAKGLYIIPLVMAYRPLLGVGDHFELLHWDVAFTMITTTLGLVSLAAAMERYLFRPATWTETLLLIVGGAGLLWPLPLCDFIGLIAFGAVIVLQKIHPQAA
jgi:TRAP-type uncharacterized transport system fused permease subunit